MTLAADKMKCWEQKVMQISQGAKPECSVDVTATHLQLVVAQWWHKYE